MNYAYSKILLNPKTFTTSAINENSQHFDLMSIQKKLRHLLNIYKKYTTQLFTFHMESPFSHCMFVIVNRIEKGVSGGA